MLRRKKAVRPLLSGAVGPLLPGAVGPLLVLACFAAVLFVSGCEDSVSYTPPAVVVSGVTINEGNVSVVKGGTAEFTATVEGENGPAQTVTWSIEGDHHEGTSISEDGVLSVSTAETAATLTVRATSTANIAKYGEVTVTITSSTPTVSSVTVSGGSDSVAKGQSSVEFTATVEGANGPAQTVTWSVSGNSDAATEISEDGVLSVGAEETAETLTVRATSTVDTSKYGEAQVTVVVGGAVTINLAVEDKGGTLAFTNTPEAGVTIYKSGDPASLTFTLDTETTDGFYNFAWYVDLVLKGSGGSVTLNAADYFTGGHSLVLTAIDAVDVPWSLPPIWFTVADKAPIID